MNNCDIFATTTAIDWKNKNKKHYDIQAKNNNNTSSGSDNECDFRSVRTKHYKSWHWQLPCLLAFSNTKRLYKMRSFDCLWKASDRSETSLRCLLAQGNFLNEDIITITTTERSGAIKVIEQKRNIGTHYDDVATRRDVLKLHPGLSQPRNRQAQGGL